MDETSSSSSLTSMGSKDPRTIARKYQLDLCKKALEENIIVYLGTGCGKTHIAVLLMYELRNLIRKPSKQICVFLAPTIPLVRQQAIVIENSTEFKVRSYYGSSKRLKDHNEWKEETETFEVFIMTPQIFLHNLSHCYMKMELISLLVFDECHHAQAEKRHPYAQIMKEFYDKEDPNRPRILGMTASPIIGKGGSNHMNYTKSINSLEELLDAKVCSVEDDDLELISVAASPDIKLYFYDPINHSSSRLILNYVKKLEDLKSECLELLSGKLSDVKDHQKGMKSLWKLHENLIFCLQNLGLFGALQSAKMLLANSGFGLEEERDSSFRNLYLKKSIFLLTDGLDDDTTTDDSFTIETFEEPFFSQKLLCLIEILSRFNMQETTKCIIFVKRIVVARCLAYVLGRLSCLAAWRSEFLVGCNSGAKTMSRQKMNAIVQRFCSGEVNLLVATSVAEEGLDIQTCCLVIRFDLPETITSFIQSRGRARMMESKYIFILEKGNQQHEKQIEAYISGENKMNNEIGYRSSNETFNPLEESIYKVESTGASISTGSSVSLLHRYCDNLPRDMYFTPMPDYVYMDEVNGVVCRVILPPNAAVRQVASEPRPSKDLAKRHACLVACQKLHEFGALNEYLLPDVISKKTGGSMRLFPDSNDTDDENMREELHEMQVPALLKESWPSEINENVMMHFYYIKFMPVPNDRDYRMFGLFLMSKLPDEAEQLQLDLHLSHSRIVRTELQHLGLMSFNSDQMRIAQEFQEMWLKIILDRSEFASERVTLGKLEALLRHEGSTFYLLLPVKQQNYGENHSKVVVDWDTMKLCLASPIFGNEANSQISRGDSANSDLVLRNGVFRKSDLIGSLVYMPHNGLFFFVDGVLHEMDASSAIQACTTYDEYFKDKFNVELLHPAQPLLKAKQLFNMRNLLHNRVQGNTDAKELDEHFVELPPEICCLKVVGFSKDIGSSLSLLPSLMHRLENLLVAIELKHLMLASFPEASQIPANCILEAITTEKCMERFSLERFEVLGDAFLKYTVGRHSFLSYGSLDEGQLTRKRSSIVNNQNLYELAIEKNLQVFIRDQPFEPSQFFPLGRPCPKICSNETKSLIHSRKPNSNSTYSNSDSYSNSSSTYSEKPEKCTGSHHWLHRKTIADVIESLVGVFLVESGFKSAIAFLKWIGIETEFEIKDLERACELSKTNLSLLDSVNFEELERIVGHEFKFKGLLMQALIHPSYNKHSGGCYQKLEYLGDAVLEYLITSYLFSLYPELKPGQLTDLRSASVSNASLALVAVRRSLHKFLVKDSAGLGRAIGQFERYVGSEEGETERDLVDGPACPKVLGDIVESCIGALLLDTGFDLAQLWPLTLSLLQPALAFQSLQINPLRELRELCQALGFELRLPPPVKLGKTEGYCVNVEVVLEGGKGTVVCKAVNRNSKAGKKLAAQEALLELKSRGYKHKNKTLEEILKTARKNEAQLIGFDEEPIEIKTGISIPESELSILRIGEFEELGFDLKNSKDTYGGEISGERKTARTELFEICQANYWDSPFFDCVNIEGPPHLKMFTYKVTVKIRGVKSEFVECFGEPKAKKKYAQESAAEGALWYLKKNCIMP